jgi:rSAM/selenodomain-associated transferase 1
VLVIAKAPVAGDAKTRLAQVVGPRQAAHIAAIALIDTLRVAGDVFDARILAMAGRLSAAEDASAVAEECRRWTVIGQRGGSLSARLASAHRSAARAVSGSPVLQIGMDTPQLTANLLAGAAATLATGRADAVLGPAEDGGWWALGLRDPSLARVLHGVPMSHPDTAALTLRALHRVGVRVEMLPMLRDVDTWADAIAVAALAPDTDFADAVGAQLVRM